MTNFPLSRQLVYTEKKSVDDIMAMSPLMEKLLQRVETLKVIISRLIRPSVFMNEVLYRATEIMKNPYPTEIDLEDYQIELEDDLETYQELYASCAQEVAESVMSCLYAILSLDKRAKEHCRYFLPLLSDYMRGSSGFDTMQQFVDNELSTLSTYDIDLRPHPVEPEALNATWGDIMNYTHLFSGDGIAKMIKAYPLELRRRMTKRIEHSYNQAARNGHSVRKGGAEFFKEVYSQLDEAAQKRAEKAAQKQADKANQKQAGKSNQKQADKPEQTPENSSHRAELEALNTQLNSLNTQLESKDAQIASLKERIKELEAASRNAAAEEKDTPSESKKLSIAQNIILFSSILDLSLSPSDINQTALATLISQTTGYRSESVRQKIVSGIDYEKPQIKQDARKIAALLEDVKPELSLQIRNDIEE